MFRQELDLFAETVRTGRVSELSADNANVSLSVVYAALLSDYVEWCRGDYDLLLVDATAMWEHPKRGTFAHGYAPWY